MRKLLAVLAVIVSALMASCSSTEAFESPIASEESLTLEEKLLHFGARPLSVPLPEVFNDGSQWLEAMTGIVAEAEDYILLTTFLGSSSEALEPLYRAMMEASERGVRIYFIMDGISSYDMTETKNHMTPLYFLRSSGIHIEEYNPVTAMHLINPATIVVRDHRKIMVVDGRIAAIGGMNMNFISMGTGEGETQRDSMYLFSSPSLAAALRDEFVSIWNGMSVEKISEEDFPVFGPSPDEVYPAYLVSSDGIAGMYASLFSSAEESVMILPYLPALDSRMKSAVSAASSRVPVTMLIPVDLRGYAANGIYHELPDLIRETGVRVFVSIYDENGELLPLLHEKLMLVDSRYAVIGSANFNFRSMGLSEEIALVIDSPELVAGLEEHVDSIMESAEEITLDEAEMLKEEKGNAAAYLFTFIGG